MRREVWRLPAGLIYTVSSPRGRHGLVARLCGLLCEAIQQDPEPEPESPVAIGVRQVRGERGDARICLRRDGRERGWRARVGGRPLRAGGVSRRCGGQQRRFVVFLQNKSSGVVDQQAEQFLTTAPLCGPCSPHLRRMKVWKPHHRRPPSTLTPPPEVTTELGVSTVESSR